MNKYSDKSDFEINKAVAVNINGSDAVVEKFGRIYISDSDAMVSFDPCSNPYDAMPIIIENGISSLFNDDEWICSAPYTEFLSINESLYRAAMEVFLMMKEAENEK
ncbi:phage protein NinX family protein [Morganella morganii]|uniref:phage protein NinX family protein n=1 Tax=Morganella morganii TaxID=582 RepID=UPI001BD9FD35|nr:phage protein NinX family protein [Morganella morganii]MBT0494063.1 DUF2591 family protein [Morganella morganii subsp. morganii]QWL94389.1 DUF2591 family protein [Morganella morganii subsp. morganii]